MKYLTPIAALALGLGLATAAEVRPAAALTIGQAFVSVDGAAFGATGFDATAFGLPETFPLFLATQMTFTAGFDLPLETPALYSFAASASLDGNLLFAESGALGVFALSDLAPATEIAALLAGLDAFILGGPYAGLFDGGSYVAGYEATFTPLDPTSFSGTLSAFLGVRDTSAFEGDLAADLDEVGLPGFDLAAIAIGIFDDLIAPELPFEVAFRLDAALTAETEVIPLPAAAPLMLGALGVLGLAARRRRKV